MHLSSKTKSRTTVIRFKTTAGLASLLVLVIDIELGKIAASFLADWDK